MLKLSNQSNARGIFCEIDNFDARRKYHFNTKCYAITELGPCNAVQNAMSKPNRIQCRTKSKFQPIFRFLGTANNFCKISFHLDSNAAAWLISYWLSYKWQVKLLSNNFTFQTQQTSNNCWQNWAIINRTYFHNNRAKGDVMIAHFFSSSEVY